MAAAGSQAAAGGEPNAAPHNKMVAISFGANIRLWSVGDDGSRVDVGELRPHCLLGVLCPFLGNVTQYLQYLLACHHIVLDV